MGIESQKKSKDKELESSESTNKIDLSFFKPESYLGILKSLGGAFEILLPQVYHQFGSNKLLQEFGKKEESLVM